VALHATKSSILFFLVFCEEGFKISDDSGWIFNGSIT
jgi:hypothetical protein